MKLIDQVKAVELVPDWRKVLQHTWSIRLILASGVLNALATALMFGDALPIPPVVLFVLTFLVNAAAFAARIISQKRFRETQP